MSETTTTTKSELRVVPMEGTGLLVLGTDDIQRAAAHIRRELHVDHWGGSFGGHYVRRYSNGKPRWSSRDPQVWPFPKDAQPGVLFTTPRYTPRRELVESSAGTTIIRASCSRNHFGMFPNTVVGRASAAAWEKNHQHGDRMSGATS